MAASLDKPRVYAAFHEAVNMTPGEIDEWLTTPKSKAVGQKKMKGAESVGHASGRRIAAILGKPEAELNDEDYLHMRKVVGYVRRHRAQEPANLVTSRWRYALMNWGHDPVK
jgi:hypothetical protein